MVFALVGFSYYKKSSAEADFFDQQAKLIVALVYLLKILWR
jgi:hypothetical protein